MSCGCFSTTVQVHPDILKERGEEAFAVHGITNEEIKQGPSFEQAWTRFLKWIDDVTNSATKYEVESDDDTGLPTLLEDPAVVLVAHNGIRFDFPLLLCELLRNNLSTTMFERWYFVDTLHTFKDLNKYECIKLHCLARDTMTDPGSRSQSAGRLHCLAEYYECICAADWDFNAAFIITVLSSIRFSL